MSKHKRATGPPCARCTQPAGGATLCRACTQLLTRLLTEAPGLAADLDITTARQDRITGHTTGPIGGNTHPGPLWDERSSTATRALRAALTALLPGDTAPRPIPALAAHLRTRIDTIRHTPTAAAAFAALDDATRQARRAIDRPTERLYLGGCGHCDGDVYAPLGATHGRCRACRAHYDVTARREQILAQVADWSVPRDQITHLGGSLYPEIKPGTVRSWISRGTLTPTGWGIDGAPRYRIGDVAHLATTAATHPRRSGGQAA